MDQHFYINLKNRPEKNQQTITELRKLGIKPNKINRFDAISHEVGLIGCVLSHIAVLEKAKELGWNYCIIFEDDIQISSKKKVIEKFNKYINYDYDVLYLGCWNVKRPIPIENDLSRVVKAWCTNNKYNIDDYIECLQKKDKWLMITPIYITQRDGWSDSFNTTRNLSKIIKTIPL